MPGSFQKTRISPRKISVQNKRVIRFLSSPRYRNLPVDISLSDILVLYDIKELKGNNEGGKRAKVDNVSQRSKRCKVIIDGCKCKIFEFTGEVSEGIEEV